MPNTDQPNQKLTLQQREFLWDAFLEEMTDFAEYPCPFEAKCIGLLSVTTKERFSTFRRSEYFKQLHLTPPEESPQTETEAQDTLKQLHEFFFNEPQQLSALQHFYKDKKIPESNTSALINLTQSAIKHAIHFRIIEMTHQHMAQCQKTFDQVLVDTQKAFSDFGNSSLTVDDFSSLIPMDSCKREQLIKQFQEESSILRQLCLQGIPGWTEWVELSEAEQSQIRENLEDLLNTINTYHLPLRAAVQLSPEQKTWLDSKQTKWLAICERSGKFSSSNCQQLFNLPERGKELLTHTNARYVMSGRSTDTKALKQLEERHETLWALYATNSTQRPINEYLALSDDDFLRFKDTMSESIAFEKKLRKANYREEESQLPDLQITLQWSKQSKKWFLNNYRNNGLLLKLAQASSQPVRYWVSYFNTEEKKQSLDEWRTTLPMLKVFYKGPQNTRRFSFLNLLELPENTRKLILKRTQSIECKQWPKETFQWIIEHSEILTNIYDHNPDFADSLDILCQLPNKDWLLKHYKKISSLFETKVIKPKGNMTFLENLGTYIFEKENSEDTLTWILNNTEIILKTLNSLPLEDMVMRCPRLHQWESVIREIGAFIRGDQKIKLEKPNFSLANYLNTSFELREYINKHPELPIDDKRWMQENKEPFIEYLNMNEKPFTSNTLDNFFKLPTIIKNRVIKINDNSLNRISVDNINNLDIQKIELLEENAELIMKVFNLDGYSSCSFNEIACLNKDFLNLLLNGHHKIIKLLNDASSQESDSDKRTDCTTSIPIDCYISALASNSSWVFSHYIELDALKLALASSAEAITNPGWLYFLDHIETTEKREWILKNKETLTSLYMLHRHEFSPIPIRKNFFNISFEEMMQLEEQERTSRLEKANKLKFLNWIGQNPLTGIHFFTSYQWTDTSKLSDSDISILCKNKSTSKTINTLLDDVLPKDISKNKRLNHLINLLKINGQSLWINPSYKKIEIQYLCAPHQKKKPAESQQKETEALNQLASFLSLSDEDKDFILTFKSNIFTVNSSFFQSEETKKYISAYGKLYTRLSKNTKEKLKNSPESILRNDSLGKSNKIESLSKKTLPSDFPASDLINLSDKDLAWVVENANSLRRFLNGNPLQTVFDLPETARKAVLKDSSSDNLIRFMLTLDESKKNWMTSRLDDITPLMKTKNTSLLKAFMDNSHVDTLNDQKNLLKISFVVEDYKHVDKYLSYPLSKSDLNAIQLELNKRTSPIYLETLLLLPPLIRTKVLEKPGHYERLLSQEPKTYLIKQIQLIFSKKEAISNDDLHANALLSELDSLINFYLSLNRTSSVRPIDSFGLRNYERAIANLKKYDTEPQERKKEKKCHSYLAKTSTVFAVAGTTLALGISWILPTYILSGNLLSTMPAAFITPGAALGFICLTVATFCAVMAHLSTRLHRKNCVRNTRLNMIQSIRKVTRRVSLTPKYQPIE